MALTLHIPITIIEFVQGGRSMKFIHKLMLGSKGKIVLSSIGVLALVLFTGVLVVEATKSEVVIVANGEEQVVDTHKNTVAELFSEEGIEIGAHDELSHEEDAPIENGMTIDYQTAKQITVTIDGTAENYYTTEDTILGFFKEEDLSFSEHDAVSHEVDEEIEEGLEIIVDKAFEVTINDGGEKETVQVTEGTIEDLLEEQEIDLNKKDKIEPELDEKVTEETTIDIVRITSETVEEKETLSFETEEQEDDSLLKGEEKVITQGEDGQVVKKYKVTKENGEEVSRDLVDEEVTKERTNHIVAIGTKEEPVEEVNTDDNDADLVTLSSKAEKEPTSAKTLTMTASAFSASCNGCSGVTATGINLSANPNQKVIAVDPNVIPLGSRVWVDGYGEAIAGDTGGAIKGNRIDVHVPNSEQANQWGVRTVQVKVLD